VGIPHGTGIHSSPISYSVRPPIYRRSDRLGRRIKGFAPGLFGHERGVRCSSLLSESNTQPAKP
jgi:hypothetical protein